MQFLGPEVGGLGQSVVDEPLHSQDVFTSRNGEEVNTPLPSGGAVGDRHPTGGFELFQFPLSLAILDPAVIGLVGFRVRNHYPQDFGDVLFLREEEGMSDLFFHLRQGVLVRRVLFDFLISSGEDFLLTF